MRKFSFYHTDDEIVSQYADGRCIHWNERRLLIHIIAQYVRSKSWVRGVNMPQWWFKFRLTIRGILFPLICIQFVRTLIIPNPFDVFILFMLFLIYLGFLLSWY